MAEKIVDNFNDYLPYQNIEDCKKHIEKIILIEKNKSKSLDVEISKKIANKNKEEKAKKLLEKTLKLINFT